jgi:hypothetical protein
MAANAFGAGAAGASSASGSHTNAFNIEPRKWGPHLWATLHTLALKADADNEVEAYLEFVNSLFFLLPCDACRADFMKWYNANGGPLVGQAFEWSVSLHNHVNRKLGYSEMTVEEARAEWNSDLCSYSCNRTIGGRPTRWMLIPIIIIALGWILWILTRQRPT